MKNKKEFFGVLISVFVCVFVVGIIVYATTTVSDDITVGDDLTVTDDLIVTGLASVAESFRVPTIYGATAAGEYLRIGDEALTSHSLGGPNDILVTGMLEVDNTAFFDGTVSISDDLTVGGDDFSFVRGGVASLSSTLWVGGTATFAVGASVSDDISMAKASISDQLWIGPARIFSGTASITQDIASCSLGDIYIKTGTAGMSGILSFCDATSTWTATSLSWDNQ